MTTAAQVITTLAAFTAFAVSPAKADTLRSRSGASYKIDSKLASLLLGAFKRIACTLAPARFRFTLLR